MSIYNGTHSIIHSANSANLTAFTYTQVYAGSASTAIVNDTTLTLAAGSLLNIKIRSISGLTGNVYVLGDKINV